VYSAAKAEGGADDVSVGGGEGESNVVRCSAVEGMGLLSLHEDSLRDEAEEMVERYLREGTVAMKSRARGVQRSWARAEQKKR
jgi:hypothetical protein